MPKCQLPPSALPELNAIRKYHREYRRKRRADPEYRAKENKRAYVDTQRRRAKLREELFRIYGDVCACCGESEKRFLTLEHKNGSGQPDSNFIRMRTLGQERIWKDAIEANDPSKFETLCYNCNIGKAANKGVCPHKAQK